MCFMHGFLFFLAIDYHVGALYDYKSSDWFSVLTVKQTHPKTQTCKFRYNEVSAGTGS